MSTLVISAVTFAIFLLGLYLGHRWGSHDARIEADTLRRRCQRILGFAAPYIDAHAEAECWIVDRNEDGEITDLHGPPIRCGTHGLLLKEMLAERDRRKTLH